MSIDLSVLDKEFKEHMENQPYTITCSNCGGSLDCANINVDCDYDLEVKVDPCKTCIDEAVEETKQE